jgi:hypothetical protein
MAKSEKDAEKVVKFLTKLRVNWGKRFESESAEDAWLDQMIEELACYSVETLHAAARTLLRSRRDYFPKLGECIDACNAAKKDIEMQQPGFWAHEQKKQTSAHNFSLAYELLKSTPDGRQSAREGWVLSFFWFVVRNGCAPDAEQKARMIREADEVQPMYSELNRGALFPKPPARQGTASDLKRQTAIDLENMCIAMANSMAARREKLIAHALGEASV